MDDIGRSRSTFVEEPPAYWNVSFDSLFSFRIVEEAGADCACAPHWHGCMEFLLIVEGSLSVGIDGACHEVQKGDMVTLSPGVIHSLGNPRGDTLIRIFLFGYDLLDESTSDIHERILRKSSYKKQIFNDREDGEFYRRTQKIYADILDEYRQKKIGYQMAIRAKLLEAEILYFRSIDISNLNLPPVPRTQKNIRRLERIFEYIHKNFDDPELSIEQAAEAAVLSVSHFIVFFRQQSGEYFHDCLTRLRLSYAKQQLLSSDQLVTDIAYNCGFNSLPTFSRLFKTHTGLTPSMFRKINNTF
jgi:AraC-like DNA-binding protein